MIASGLEHDQLRHQLLNLTTINSVPETSFLHENDSFVGLISTATKLFEMSTPIQSSSINFSLDIKCDPERSRLPDSGSKVAGICSS